jgi:hypothetical protein
MLERQKVAPMYGLQVMWWTGMIIMILGASTSLTRNTVHSRLFRGIV